MIWNRHSKRYSDRTSIENKEKGAGMIRISGNENVASRKRHPVRGLDRIRSRKERKNCIKPWSAGKGVRDKIRRNDRKKEGDRWPVRLICDMRSYVKMIFPKGTL